jgi:hypothetical protein
MTKEASDFGVQRLPPLWSESHPDVTKAAKKGSDDPQMEKMDAD